MLIEQIIEFELKGSGPPSRTCKVNDNLMYMESMYMELTAISPVIGAFITVYYHDKTKIFEANIYCKNIARGNVPYFHYLGQITYKI